MTASISLCLCTFNGAAHLAAQLESIAEQTRLPDEIVVGDDGSTDDTLEVLDRWAATSPIPVSVERLPGRRGHLANLDGVLRRAEADIVFLCDQDDRWHPEKLARMMSLLTSAPALAGAFCDSALIGEAGEPLEGSLWQTLGFGEGEQAAVSSGRGLGVLLRRNVVAGHALAFRRDRLDLLLPFPDIHHADWWLAVGLLLDGGIAPVRERLVDYRLHSRNTVGLRGRTPARSRFETVDPRERSRGDAELLSAFVERLDAVRPGLLGDADRALVEAKISHARVRANLPPSRVGRLLPVMLDLVTGRYQRFSNGWRSAVVDLGSSH